MIKNIGDDSLSPMFFSVDRRGGMWYGWGMRAEQMTEIFGYEIAENANNINNLANTGGGALPKPL